MPVSLCRRHAHSACTREQHVCSYANNQAGSNTHQHGLLLLVVLQRQLHGIQLAS
jgi:hypothetical protein